MGDKQQGNPKRYQVEFAVNAAPMEDALSSNLGQATTEFLNAIGLIDKKGNPVELTGNNTKIKVETKTKTKNDKAQNLTKTITPTKLMYECNQEGTVFKTKRFSADQPSQQQ